MCTHCIARCVLLATLMVSLCALQACSVGMAMSGKADPNTGTLQMGQSRDLVLLNLGQPSQTHLTEAGRTDVFELERGNEPSAGRAAGHAVMDVLTLGIWEVVGTPIEGVAGETFTLTIQYDTDEKVTKVTTSPAKSNF